MKIALKSRYIRTQGRRKDAQEPLHTYPLSVADGFPAPKSVSFSLFRVVSSVLPIAPEPIAAFDWSIRAIRRLLLRDGRVLVAIVSAYR